ncbi:hypothetical protein [Bradyrhizobium septentrionale]|nr:hypothetical protein [Bradyrhizobium septentrionale]
MTKLPKNRKVVNASMPDAFKETNNRAARRREAKLKKKIAK